MKTEEEVIQQINAIEELMNELELAKTADEDADEEEIDEELEKLEAEKEMLEWVIK